MRRVTHTTIASLIMLASSAVAGAVEPVAASQKMTFNINAASMVRALIQFTEQSGLQLAYPTDGAVKMPAPRVSGNLTPREALERLLKDSGLKFEFTNARTILVTPISKSEAATPQVDARMTDEQIVLAQIAAVEEAPAATTAAEQTKKSKSRNDSVEEMIVEEKRIKPFSDANVDVPRTNNDVQPYYIFDSKTIERSAALNVEDFLKRRLTMNTMAATTAQRTSSMSMTQNQSQINLRGLGIDKTLVLINGRRTTGADLSFLGSGYYVSQPDLNAIPLSAIERIEVMPSSASGIYGGSAVGGVVNVILKRDYAGGETRLSYDNTWDTDSPNRSVSANYGTAFNEGRTHVQLSAQWGDSEPMMMQDRRSLFERGLATILRNYPSNIYSPTSPFQGALPNVISYPQVVNGSLVYPNLTLKNGAVLPSSFTYIPAGTAPNTPFTALYPDLIANAGKYNLDLPPSTQAPTGLRRYLVAPANTSSLMFSVRQGLTQNVDVTLDMARRINKTAYPLTYGSSSTVPVGSPVNPFNMDVIVYYPDPGYLPVATKATSDTLTLAVTAKMPHNWTLQTDYTWSRNKSEGNYSTGINGTIQSADLAAGRINPFVDVALYPEAIDVRKYIQPSFRDFKTLNTDIALRGSGPFMSLPWGTANLTFGIEHRVGKTPENAYGSVLSENARQTDAILVWFAREQATSSAYLETLIPLLKQGERPLLHSLDAQFSVRSERYSVDAGTQGKRLSVVDGSLLGYLGPTADNRPGPDTQPFYGRDAYTSINQTAGLKYQPLQELTLRVSRATAFLPPVPYQLIKNAILDSSTPTITDPKNNGATRSIQTISGGNPDLKPQNSVSWNMGAIWEPEIRGQKNLRLNAEYYKIDQFDAIGSLGAQQIVNNESLYPERVTRNAAGLITFVDNSMLNLYKRETSGWDLSADYRVQTALGEFGFRAAESIIRALKTQGSFTAPVINTVGYPTDGGAAKHKSNFALDWSRQKWSAGWSASYFGSYYLGRNLSATDRNLLAQGSNVIPSQMYHDVYFGYTGDKTTRRGSWGSYLLSGITLQAGIKNVFDKTPPFDVRYDFYLSPYGDLRLRNYWISARKSF